MFLPNQMVEAAEAHQQGPPDPGVGVWGWIPAANLPPIEEYTHVLMPNFIEIGPVVWISIADTHSTHIDFYILDYF